MCWSKPACSSKQLPKKLFGILVGYPQLLSSLAPLPNSHQLENRISYTLPPKSQSNLAFFFLVGGWTRNKGLVFGLIKGNQWVFIDPKNKAGYFLGVVALGGGPARIPMILLIVKIGSWKTPFGIGVEKFHFFFWVATTTSFSFFGLRKLWMLNQKCGFLPPKSSH